MIITGDIYGPEYVLRVYNPEMHVWGYLVIDNTALGPGKGGIRITPTANEEETFRLARAMTYKNALAGIPFGGAKAGIAIDPKAVTTDRKRAIVEWFSRRLKPLCPRLYIAGPDMNSGEQEMLWFTKANGSWRSATGKPASYCAEIFGRGARCGIPHEFGSTGFGVAKATEVALKSAGLRVEGATVAIEGFGNVGTFVFKYLAEMGLRVIAVSDSRGGILNRQGLSYSGLMKTKRETGSVVNHRDAQPLGRDQFYALDVDVLIPAAQADVIHAANVDGVRAKVIVEGANIPMREEFEEVLYRRGTIIVPDILANAGGVISSYAEYRGYNPKTMFSLVERKVSRNVEEVLRQSGAGRGKPRDIAMGIASDRILGRKAASSRGGRR